jgi:hypothetical protein
VFYNVLDFAVINAVIVYNKVLGTKVSRCDFLLMLIDELHKISTTDTAEDSFENNDDAEIGDLEPLVLIKRQNCAVKCAKNNKE